MNTQVSIGMPHLLGNSEINLNHLAKITGDIHWNIQCKSPVDFYKNGKRVYNSFLKIAFDISDTFSEGNKFTISSSGKQLDDYIYQTTHNFLNSSISMYTIGIHVEDHKIIKTTTTGKKSNNFWKLFREEKKSIDFDKIYNTRSYKTCYLTDFNSAGILYCANYINFAYRYMNDIGIFQDIQTLYFFGNITPNEQIKIGQEGANLIMLNSQNQPIAKFNLHANYIKENV